MAWRGWSGLGSTCSIGTIRPTGVAGRRGEGLDVVRVVAHLDAFRQASFRHGP